MEAPILFLLKPETGRPATLQWSTGMDLWTERRGEIYCHGNGSEVDFTVIQTGLFGRRFYSLFAVTTDASGQLGLEVHYVDGSVIRAYQQVEQKGGSQTLRVSCPKLNRFKERL